MQLYDELKANPAAYTGNVILMQFKNKNDTSSIGKLHSVKSKMKLISEFDSLSITLINQNDSILKQKISDVRVLDSLSAANPAMNYSVQRDSIISQINTLNQQRNNIIAVRDSLANINLIVAKIINDNIFSIALPEQNQKTINDLIIKNYLYGTDSISLNYAQILSIVKQCPYSGGTAVYQARSFVNLFSDTIEYNDANICYQGGEFREESMRQKENGGVIIIPNPSNEQIEIKLKRSMNGICLINIFDALSNLVINKTLDCKIKSHAISIENLEQGVYYISITINDEQVIRDKIMVIR